MDPATPRRHVKKTTAKFPRGLVCLVLLVRRTEARSEVDLATAPRRARVELAILEIILVRRVLLVVTMLVPLAMDHAQGLQRARTTRSQLEMIHVTKVSRVKTKI